VKLKKLSPRDKKVFHKFLFRQRRELAVFAWENIFIWQGLFEISWAVIEGSLCIFFRDKWGIFLYLPPLGAKPTSGLIKQIFAQLDSVNRNQEISRIENLEENDLADIRQLGLDCKIKSQDYCCLRSDLAGLSGNKYKSQRAANNYFIKNYCYEYLPFSQKDSSGCLKLYRQWESVRKAANPDAVYQGMLEDSRNSLQVAFDNYRRLDLTGGIVKIDGQVKAFSFGYKLNSDTFCILYEITDLSIKGLAQFIFQRFCRDLSGFKYINIMDDSGLENLKKVKLSYHPVRLIPAYIAKRKP